jgi:protocatechuate 3,4-dioxygenase beta subunit
VGEEAPPLTIQLVAARMTTVSGLVLSGGGGSPPGAFVTLRPRGSDPTQILANANMTQAQNGTFNITGVAPGDYTVEAIAIDVQSRPTRIAHGSVDVVVGGTDIKDLVITTSFGVAARGRITFEDSPAPPEGVRPNQVRLTAPADNPSLGAAIGATVRDDWTFEITGLAGSRTLGVMPPSPWTLKRITRGTTDITDAPIDFSGDVDDLTIILTQRATEVSGSVGDSRGAASPDYVAVWFADDRARWGPQTRFIKTARPDQEGRYRIRGLPPGRYLAVAVDYLEPGEELDPERLEQFRRGAVTVDLREAETRTVDLKVLEF